ncbi:MAG: hypothetical protein HY840_15625 [Bacteroidetes bacterium]|nr:hypothetical protein [Bacteroidota bacterium]
MIYSLEELKKLKTNKSVKRELLKYIPIGGIACIEGWYRMAVAELIDKGLPFRKNAESFVNVKFDASSILAIHEKKLSPGELFAHFLSVNGFEELNKNLSTIAGEDFLERFKFTRINPESAPNPIYFTKDAPHIFEGVKKAFELRHIFCHELATSAKYSIRQIEHCAYGFFFFLIGADRVVQDLLEGKPNNALL